MRAVAEGASLAGVARALAVLLVAYLVAGQPAVGAWSAARLRQDLGHPERRALARLRRYRRTAVLEWSLAALALALVLAAGGLDLADVGVRWPRASAYTVVGVVGLAVSLGLLVALRRRVDRGVEVVAPGTVGALIPRTPAERRAFLGVALTAGICEELLYRGVLLAVVAVLLPGLGAVRLVLVAALVFGLAHLYQGAVGMATAVVLGGCLAVLYLGSGSLLLPVAYHVLVDLRVLVLAVQRRRPRHAATPGRRRGARVG